MANTIQIVDIVMISISLAGLLLGIFKMKPKYKDKKKEDNLK